MSDLKQIEEYVWELPKDGDMNVPGRVYGDERIIEHLYEEDKTDWSALRQLKNVATLPGLQKYALALADVHPGYGSPIGGVAAFDMEDGVITFGAVGFDINCGVRTLRTPFTCKEIMGKQEELAEVLFKDVPAGLGSTGHLKLSEDKVDEVLVNGAAYAVKQGLGFKEDLKFTEENGKLEGANPEAVSHKAKQRAYKQIGTLGSGNHYLEVQCADEIFDNEAAGAFGLEEGKALVSIHCGSRGLGHQIGTDYLKILDAATKKYGVKIKDRELVCAPINSKEGQDFHAAVKCGINSAFANRQVIAHLTRGAFAKVFGCDEKEIEMLYGIGHNTAKVEKHDVDGTQKELLVQRKGATRGFGPGREEVPEKYRKVGQPILIGGTMGTSSWILKGTEKGMHETFGSTVHGAGRVMSRVKATKQWRGNQVIADLKKQGIIVKGHGMKGIAEEAPGAYKDVVDVVDVMHQAGISTKVAKVRPLISIKG